MGFVSVRGRTSKNGFWAAYVMWGIIMMLVLGVIMGVAHPAAGSLLADFVALLVLASAIPAAALSVRRLHDSNHSGWWWLLFPTVIGMAPLLWWHLISEGTVGPNKYGPDPMKREPKSEAAHEIAVETASADASISDDPIADLKKLGQLRDQGVITEAEFSAQKARLLATI